MIYILYGVSGPIKPLFIEALKRGLGDIPADMINCKGTTRPQKSYDSDIDTKHFKDVTIFDGQYKQYVYPEYVGDKKGKVCGKFGVNEDQLNTSIQNGTTHFIICHSVDVIKKIVSDFQDVKDKRGNPCEFLLLDINFKRLYPVLATTCSEHGDDINGRQDKINKLVWALEELKSDRKDYNLKHQQITVLNDKDDIDKNQLIDLTWQALMPIVSANTPYYYWGILLNTKRLFGDDDASISDKDNFEFTEDNWKVISSAAYRRLQDKAQVFPLEKRDYPRTRMTHSEECASVAEKLGEHVVDIINSYYNKNNDIPSNQLCEKIPVLLRTAALLHDMGNPPFGHFGEECIKDWFKKAFVESDVGKRSELQDLNATGSLLDDLKKDFINYEGNAQLFRLLTSLDEVDKRFNLTYALLAVIMKYPTSARDIDKTVLEKKKPGYYFSEKDFFKKLQNEMRLKGRHPLTFMLEAADDISYLTADLVDAYKKNLVTIDYIKTAFADKQCHNVVDKIDEFIARNHFEEERENSALAMDSLHTYLKNILINEVAGVFEKHYVQIMSGKFDSDLLSKCENGKAIEEAIRYILRTKVYDCIEISQAQIKAAKIMDELLNVFVRSALAFDVKDRPALYGRILLNFSQNYSQVYKRKEKEPSVQESNKLKTYHRILLALDNICGMTDSYAELMHGIITAR